MLAKSKNDGSQATIIAALMDIYSIGQEVKPAFDDDNFDLLRAGIASRQKKMKQITQEIKKLDDDERKTLSQGKVFRDLIRTIKIMDVDNTEVINFALASTSDSIAKVGKERVANQDWQVVSSGRAKQLIDFTC